MRHAAIKTLLHCAPGILYALLLLGFGAVAPRFLSAANLGGILSQASWLVIVALGMNWVLLIAGVDLSVGGTMYLAAVAIALGLPAGSPWVCLGAAVVVGAGLGAINGLFIVAFRLPAFVVTLSTLFIWRGIGLHLSGTKVVFANAAVATIGRAHIGGAPMPLVLAAAALITSGAFMRALPFGIYARSIGLDAECARRVGVPVETVRWSAYLLCGAFAGLAGFVSLSQTSSASGAFGEHAEFLAIAAAVLGGTSLFGGRGTFWAPAVGAVLIATVQNGLVMTNANPYAYPVFTGLVIFAAASIDTVRLRTLVRLERYLLAS
jgi:ribose transport system permease protein